MIEFGFGQLDISLSDLTSPGKVIQLGYDPNRFDLMTSITGGSFDEAWASTPTSSEKYQTPRKSGLFGKSATPRNYATLEADGTIFNQAVICRAAGAVFRANGHSAPSCHLRISSQSVFQFRSNPGRAGGSPQFATCAHGRL